MFFWFSDSVDFCLMLNLTQPEAQFMVSAPCIHIQLCSHMHFHTCNNLASADTGVYSTWHCIISVSLFVLNRLVYTAYYLQCWRSFSCSVLNTWSRMTAGTGAEDKKLLCWKLVDNESSDHEPASCDNSVDRSSSRHSSHLHPPTNCSCMADEHEYDTSTIWFLTFLETKGKN